jgi:hypothetical protein
MAALISVIFKSLASAFDIFFLIHQLDASRKYLCSGLIPKKDFD